MTFLDNPASFKNRDVQLVERSINAFAEQLRSGWQTGAGLSLPRSYRDVSNIVLCGMGGSQLGADMLRALFEKEIRLPVSIVNSYDIPASVTSKTLFCALSYSGGTEEILSAAAQAKKVGAKVITLSSGGQLAEWAKNSRVPRILYNTEFNPSGQPRLGVGYSLGALLAVMNHLEVIAFSSGKLEGLAKIAVAANKKYGHAAPVRHNVAKLAAQQLAGRAVAVLGASFLSGNAHLLANQINENSKTFATYFLLPEMNHHLLEGLRFPVVNKKALSFLILESKHYSVPLRRRARITDRLVARQGIRCVTFNPSGPTPATHAVETAVFGSWMTYYLAVINRINPIAIPWVDLFKSEMKKKR